MAFCVTFFPRQSPQAAMVWNTSPLVRNSPASHSGQPLRSCLDHSCCHNASYLPHITQNDDGRRQLLGLGITLPPSVSVSLRSSKDRLISSDDDDISLRCGQASMSVLTKSPEILNEMVLTPVLRPLDLQDNISPILPLPSPVDADQCTTEMASSSTSLAELICEILPLRKNPGSSNRRFPTSGHIRMQLCASDSITTDDITSKFRGDESHVPEHTKLLPSPFEGTPTIDIADEGRLLVRNALESSAAQFGPGCDNCENGHVFLYDGDIVENPSLTSWNTTSTTHLSSIPIYYGEPQSHGLGLSPDAADLRRPRIGVRFRSNVVIRDSAGRTCKSGRGKRPIEVSSPSMTPSPPSSPKFCIPPIHLKEEGKSRAEILARRSPWTQNLSNAKTGWWRSSIVQTLKGRSSRLGRHEAAIISTRQGAWSSPRLRSPIISGHSVGVPSPCNIGDRAASSLSSAKDMLEQA